jgi:hypothetical protein
MHPRIPITAGKKTKIVPFWHTLPPGRQTPQTAPAKLRALAAPSKPAKSAKRIKSAKRGR